MLVIRRRPGEAIQIGGDVEIVVIECGPGRVRLGIRAPREIAVLRGEVKATRQQNLAAARTMAARYGLSAIGCQGMVAEGGPKDLRTLQDFPGRTDKHS